MEENKFLNDAKIKQLIYSKTPADEILEIMVKNGYDKYDAIRKVRELVASIFQI
jgi:hypothetical protein